MGKANKQSLNSKSLFNINMLMHYAEIFIGYKNDNF